MARHPIARGAGSASAGFTLVEILVVLAILAALMAMVATMVPYALKQKDKLRARSLVDNIGGTLEMLKNDADQFGKYPPTRAWDLRIGKKMVGKDLGHTNDLNVGIECIHFVINNPDIRIDHAPSTEEGAIGNTDDDKFRTIRGNASDADAREYLDPWGNPLVYINCNDYKDPKGANQILVAGQNVTIHAKKLSSKEGGGYLFPNTFQLFSLGPDGVQDDDDAGSDENAKEGDDIVYGRQ